MLFFTGLTLSVGSPKELPNIPLSRRRGRSPAAGGRAGPQTVMTTLPRAWPRSQDRIASGTSRSGYVLSMTGVRLAGFGTFMRTEARRLEALALSRGP